MSRDLVRLNKFISSHGVSSRRKADELISQGRVTVNGKTVRDLGIKVDPDRDSVRVDDETVKKDTKKVYILLNKPSGIITSVSDEKRRATVIDLVKVKEKIFPIGRLDYNTKGILLLTNDGDLANNLMHPKKEIKKTYVVKLSKPLEEKYKELLSRGVLLEGKRTSKAVMNYPRKNDHSIVSISIHEGRNRQVRKMFEKFGYFIRDLQRTEYAGLRLGNMKEGEWRFLKADEVKKLKEKTI